MAAMARGMAVARARAVAVALSVVVAVAVVVATTVALMVAGLSIVPERSLGKLHLHLRGLGKT